MDFSDNDFLFGIQCGYMECLQWTEEEDIGQNYLLSGSLKEKANKECEDFFKENKKLLRESGLHPDSCGHDFWLTRNGHGTGFWDRGLGEIGETLTESCKKFGEVYIYLGDDGQVYSD